MFENLVTALSQYQVVLRPDKNISEWWAGAPSVVQSEDGVFYLAARMREGTSDRGLRGYEIRILKSLDGIHFTPIKSITREDAGVSGFERPALAIDPATKKFRLYGCANFDEHWRIIKFDDVDDPAHFDPKSVQSVLKTSAPKNDFVYITGYKDPMIFWENGQWHMFVIGSDRVERLHHLTSPDGVSWHTAGRIPFMESTGWHNFYTRPSCVMPLAVGYLFVYEGSNLLWRDPVYNIATGIAYSPDLQTIFDITPDEPLLKSTTPGDYHTWRYSHWVPVGNKVYVYFEACCQDNTNEVRVAIYDQREMSLAALQHGKSQKVAYARQTR